MVTVRAFKGAQIYSHWLKNIFLWPFPNLVTAWDESITSLHDFPGSIVRFSSPGNSRQGSSIDTNHALPVQPGWQSILIEILCIHVNGPLLSI